MATLKGTHITNFDAEPQERVDARLHGGVVKSYKDAFEETNNDNGDVRIVFKLPIDFVPEELFFACDDLTSGTLQVGLYKKNNDGTYTAVDDDCFASDVALGSGAVAKTDLLVEAAAANIDQGISALWEWANLSARPAYGELYLGLTYSVGTGGTGTVRVLMRGTE